MGIDLYRASAVSWLVKSQETELHSFPTIEKAADFLESLGIRDEEIDYALIDMKAKSNTHAHFEIMQGIFIKSDNERPHESCGVA
jgi:hypothetical protein